MSEPRLISPLLDGYALGGPISSHSGVSCYPAMRNDSDERFIVKTISIPASQIQVDALLLTGAYPNAEAAAVYFHELADGIRSEVEILEKLAAKRGFLPYLDHQIVPMEDGVGYEVYLINHYALTLERQFKRAPLTHLSAVNMGIDLCAAMAVCRAAGYLYVDLKPENIFLPGHQEYRIGDLGFVPLRSLKYASLPDRYRSLYTPPEVADAYSTLSDTMDIYALGLVLYQVYNNGELPFDSEESRNALMASGEPLPAPAYADYEMAQIIAKACAFHPDERWASPDEMGHALISYMQRNGANDVPIVPPSVPEIVEEEPIPESEEAEPAIEEDIPQEAPSVEEETAPAEEEVAPVEEETTAEDPAEPEAEEVLSPVVPESEEAEIPVAEDSPEAEEIPPVGENADTETAPEQPAESDWIDRMDAILAEDQLEEQTPEEEPSLRELLEPADDQDAASIDTSDVSDEIADILSQVQALIDHEVPAPVVAPEPIEISMPEQAEESQDLSNGEEVTAPESSQTEDAPADSQPQKPKRKWVKRLLGSVAAILVIALLAAGAYYHYNEIYLQHIDAFTLDGQDNQITVTVETNADQSLLTVVCQDTYGNVLRKSVENGTAVFTDLLPGTQYIVTLEIEGFHELTGNHAPATYSTPEQTQIINFAAVTGLEDGSVILSFGVEGVDSQDWTVTYAAEGEEPQSQTFSGHTVTISGLTVGSEYTFTLEGVDDIYLVGEHSLTCTASAIVLAENLTVSGYNDGTITATWAAPEGTNVERWIARCYNEDGYNQVQEITGTTVTFTDITLSAGYTVEVTAANMTIGTRTFVTANPVTVNNVKAHYAEGQITVTWEFEGQTPEGGWVVLYTVDQGIVQQVVNSVEASAVIPNVAPDSDYVITIQTANSTSVFGSNTTQVYAYESESFSANRLNTNNVFVSMYQAPETEGWTYKDLKDADAVSIFSPNGKMAVMYRTSSRYNTTSASYVTLFVIRDANGDVVSISTHTRPWNEMWDNGYCVEEISQLPADPGKYILDIYLNNTKLTRQSFTIT